MPDTQRGLKKVKQVVGKVLLIVIPNEVRNPSVV